MNENTSPDAQSHRESGERAHAVGGGAATRRASGKATRPRAAKPAPVTRTLAAAREAFVATIARDTPSTDRTRLVKVLDALIAWSVARPARLAFRTDEKRTDVLAFARAGTGDVFWSAIASRGASPTLEIHMPAAKPGSADDRAMVMQTLNAHSRNVLVDGDRLRIGFGALKNEAARAAVLACMQQLLVREKDSAEPRSD